MILKYKYIVLGTKSKVIRVWTATKAINKKRPLQLSRIFLNELDTI